LALGLTTLRATMSAAPWVPTRSRDIGRLVALTLVGPQDLLVELGSGDGRLLLALVQASGGRGVGYELSLPFWLVSRWQGRRAGLGKRVQFMLSDMYKADVSKAQLVVGFFLPKALPRLEQKLVQEMPAGSTFVSLGFPLPNRQPSQVMKENNEVVPLYLYRF